MKTLQQNVFAVGFSLLIAASPCAAAQKTWKGHQVPGGDRKWETNANWNPNGVPGADDDVTIPANVGNVIITDDTATKKIKSFTMEAAGGGFSTSKLTSKLNGAGDAGVLNEAIDMDIEAKNDIVIKSGTVNPPQSGSTMGVGLIGGYIYLSSTDGAIRLVGNPKIIGGRGGGMGAAQAGRGGSVKLVAKKDVRNVGGIIWGGTSGNGSAAPPAGTEWARGGDVTIESQETVLNRGVNDGIQGGNGRGRGGDVKITAKNVSNDYTYFSTLIAGGQAGGGTSERGGNILIVATDTITNRGGFTDPALLFEGVIRGGIGSKGTPTAVAGRGGSVSMSARQILNSGGNKPGWILGGRSGEAGMAGAVRGGSVLLLALEKISMGARLEGGNGSGGAAAGQPVGFVVVQAQLIDKAKAVRAGFLKLLGVIGALGGAAGADVAATPLIDLSGAPEGAIVAEEGICIDASPVGTINLCGASSLAIVSDGGSGSLEFSGAAVMVGSIAQPQTISLSQAVTGGYLDAITSPLAEAGTGCGTTCASDLNHDGRIDGADVGLLLGHWGPALGSEADLNHDGVVNGIDLGMMLGQWGACPEAA